MLQEIRTTQNADEMKRWLDRLTAVRGRASVYPYLESGRGSGAYVELLDGSVKLDFISGIGVHFFGHAHAGLTQEIVKAVQEDGTSMCGHLQYSKRYIEFAENMLVAANALRPTALAHCWVSPSGALANENALKICRQKRTPGYRVLHFQNGFYGRTQTMAELSSNASYREGLPLFDQVDGIPFFRSEDPDGSLKLTLAELDRRLERAEDYAVFVAELLQGEGGFATAPTTFFKEVFSRVRAKGIPVWIDEVQTVGRTGEFFLFQRLGLEDMVDVVTAGKMLQACATLYRAELNPRPGLISGTFAASAAALAVGNWTLRELDRGGYLGPRGKIRQLETLARDELTRMEQNTCRGWLSNITVVGSMVAFQVFKGTDTETRAFLQKLFQRGVIAFSCGRDPCRVRCLLPGGVLSAHDLHVGLQVVAETLKEMATT